MKIALFLSVIVAVLAIAEGSPINRLPSFSKNGQMGSTKVFAVFLSRNPQFKHDFKAQFAKMNQRYTNFNILTGGNGTVPAINSQNDLEYHGTVSFGIPPKEFKMNFDTGSADTWVPSSNCSSCTTRTQFDSTKSSTFQKDGRKWKTSYGSGRSSVSGVLGSDIVNVGGNSVRQTIGLAAEITGQFKKTPYDGLFGIVFDAAQSVAGVKTFMDNAIEAGVLSQPVFSVFLPSVRRNGGVGSEYLFGAIDSTKYTGDLTYVEVSNKSYWQSPMEGITYNSKSLGQAHDIIIDTGTSYAALSSDAAIAIHNNIKGADAVLGESMLMWNLPCSLQNSTDNVGFTFGGKTFNIPMADIVIKNPDDGACFSGIYGRKDSDIGVLGDLFIKNNYSVFDQGTTPRIGLAPLRY